MTKIVVFDSGLGSLSIIKAIQKICKADIVYYAEQKNYTYGDKSKAQLDSIIKKTLNNIQTQFSPDFIVMASNTSTLILNLPNSKVIGVKPPVREAIKISKSKKNGILGTKSVIKSKGLSKYIQENNFSNSRETLPSASIPDSRTRFTASISSSLTIGLVNGIIKVHEQ